MGKRNSSCQSAVLWAFLAFPGEFRGPVSGSDLLAVGSLARGGWIWLVLSLTRLFVAPCRAACLPGAGAGFVSTLPSAQVPEKRMRFCIELCGRLLPSLVLGWQVWTVWVIPQPASPTALGTVGVPPGRRPQVWVGWGPWHKLCGARPLGRWPGERAACASQPPSGQLRGRPGLHGLKRQLAVLGQKQESRAETYGSCLQNVGPRPERALSPRFPRRL